jgi:hypothetical protein
MPSSSKNGIGKPTLAEGIDRDSGFPGSPEDYFRLGGDPGPTVALDVMEMPSFLKRGV